MKRHDQLLLSTLGATLILAGCRVEPGGTDYASQQISDFIDESDAGEAMFLPGPHPYVEGEARLAFGPFYEGASSESIPVNDVTNFLFVFDAAGVSSLEIEAVEDRVEGFSADALRLTGAAFWGMSIAFFDRNPGDGGTPRPEDLSAYSTMFLSLKSSDGAFGDVRIAIGSSSGEGAVQASDYGYANDGDWHSLAIPLADFGGADVTGIHTPLILGGNGTDAGDELLIDAFYYAAPAQ